MLQSLPQTTVQGCVTNGAAGVDHLESGSEPILDPDNVSLLRDVQLFSSIRYDRWVSAK